MKEKQNPVAGATSPAPAQSKPLGEVVVSLREMAFVYQNKALLLMKTADMIEQEEKP